MTKRMKGISRIDQSEKHHHGWYVRVDYGLDQKHKWFADKKHGGKRPALAAAEAYVRTAHKQLQKPFTKRRVVVVARSNTRKVGITKEKYGYVVSWKNSRRYVPKAAGIEKALRLRKQKAAEMYKEGAIA
jgi:hypothetical protein